MRVDFWSKELTDVERDALLEKAAAEIRRRKLEIPAILLLESSKPLTFFFGTSAIMFAPFLVPFFGFDSVNDYSILFKDRENVERLIRLLEDRAPASIGEKA